MSMLRNALFAATIALAVPGAAQEAAAPPMLNTPTAGWTVCGPGQMHKARKDGAGADHAAGAVNVALTLGDAARTVDLGPAFVMKAE